MSVRAGYLEPSFNVEFRDGVWCLNNLPIESQVCLSEYPRFTVSGSELGSLCVVLGDEEQEMLGRVHDQGVSGTETSILKEAVDSIWILGIYDAFYIATVASSGYRVLPLAINAFDVEQFVSEMHLYLNMSDELQVATLLIFENNGESPCGFLSSSERANEECACIVSFLPQSGIIATISPDICNFSSRDSTEYIQAIGNVEVYLSSSSPEGISSLAETALTNMQRWANGVYVPTLDTPLITITPQILTPKGGEGVLNYIAVSRPVGSSLAERLITITDEDSGSENWGILAGIVAASQCIAITGTDKTFSCLCDMLFSEDEELLERCVQQDFLYPDAITFWVDHGLTLGDVSLENIDELLECDFTHAAFERLRSGLGSSFTWEYANNTVDKKRCFRRGKRGNGALPSVLPYGLSEMEKNAVLMSYANYGVVDNRRALALLNYVNIDLLLWGGYAYQRACLCFGSDLYSAVCYDIRMFHEAKIRAMDMRVNPEYYTEDGKPVNSVREDALKDQGILRRKIGYTIPQSNTTIRNTQLWMLTRAQEAIVDEYTTLYKYTSFVSRSQIDTGIDWLLICSGLSPVMSDIPRSLNGYLTEMKNDMSFMYGIVALVALWQRTLLGTMSVCPEPGCKLEFDREFALKDFRHLCRNISNSSLVIQLNSSNEAERKLYQASVFELIDQWSQWLSDVEQHRGHITGLSKANLEEELKHISELLNEMPEEVRDASRKTPLSGMSAALDSEVKQKVIDLLLVYDMYYYLLGYEPIYSKHFSYGWAYKWLEAARDGRSVRTWFDGATFQISDDIAGRKNKGHCYRAAGKDQPFCFLSAIDGDIPLSWQGVNANYAYQFRFYYSLCFSSCDYINSHVNAALALSDQTNEAGFYHQYVEAYSALMTWLRPMLQACTDYKKTGWELLLAVLYLQEHMSDYTLDSMKAAISQNSDITVLPKAMLDWLAAQGVTGTVIPDLYAQQILQPSAAVTQAVDEDIEDIPEEVAGLISASYVTEDPQKIVLQRAVISGTGLQTLLPRMDLVSNVTQELNKPSEDSIADELFGPSAEEQVVNDVAEDEFSDLDELEELVKTPSTEFDDLSDMDTSNKSSAMAEGFDDLSDVEQLSEEPTGTVQDEPSDESVILNSELASDETWDDLGELMEIVDEAPSAEPEEVLENKPQTPVEASESLILNSEPAIEYIYSATDPSLCSGLVQEAVSRNKKLASRAVVLYSGTSAIMIPPEVQSLVAFCREKNGDCYFDADCKLIVELGNVTYQVYGVYRDVKSIERDIARNRFNPDLYHLSRVALEYFV